MPTMSRRTRQVLSTALAVAVLGALWWIQGGGAEDDGSRADSSSSTSVGDRAEPGEDLPARDEHGIAWVALQDLPPEAAETVALIDAGGPYPYPGKDDSTFGNFEGLLPDRERGYYAEYTVETPGLDHRGARRIVAGDGGELYWTEDHYESFERIRR